MKKLIFIILACTLIASCSSKTVTYSALGKKEVSTKTDAAAFSEAQATAYVGYYKAINSPPVLATITHADGSVITINSPIRPPAPMVKQHENQYIKPMMSTLKTGITIIGGGHYINEALDTMQGINITNTGKGSVVVDKSETIDTEVNHAEDGSTFSQGSGNDSSDQSDNHIENADPTIVNPVIVDKDVVVVEPSYPPVVVQ